MKLITERYPMATCRLSMSALMICYGCILLLLVSPSNAFQAQPNHARRISSRNRRKAIEQTTTQRSPHRKGGVVSTTTTHTPLFSSMTDAFASLSLVNWEDLLYQTESAASSLAAVSLKDPSNLVTALPIMYVAGLLTSFSPCVWGLLPLTVSYITAAAGERQDQQTVLPTAAFAAGLAMVFCSLGVAAVEFGQVFGSTTGASGVVLPILSNLICLTMGLKLLELIDLPLPKLDFINPQRRSAASDAPLLIDATGQILSPTKASESNEGNALVRTFLLGGSSALVASPCATPVLTSILAFVATASNPGLGALLLLGYTLGYSTPLLLVAGTGGQALVKLRQKSGSGWYATLAPWVTPITGGILLYLGTNGMLTALFGDPSLAGLAILD